MSGHIGKHDVAFFEFLFISTFTCFRYLALLDRYPIATKSVTSMIINMAGDLFCQVSVHPATKLHAVMIAYAHNVGDSAFMPHHLTAGPSCLGHYQLLTGND